MDGPLTARVYHEQTKHRVERLARGPETVDWTSPPDPFRSFAGAPRLALPLTRDARTRPFSSLGSAAEDPAPLTLESVSVLLELTFGIAAWKRQGPDTWAVRCIPSSGNLHPTEAYLIARGITGIPDGLHHYDPREHALEQRRRDGHPHGGPKSLQIGMSSVHWCQAWKYGERGFRYCQLDPGHALAGLHYAAAALGWRVQVLSSPSSKRVARTLGLDRAEDFAGAEPEEPALILAVAWGRSGSEASSDLDVPSNHEWTGRANRLDQHPMYRWPIIDAVALHTRKPATLGQLALAPGTTPPAATPFHSPPESVPGSRASAAAVIRARRSAQRFDARFVLSAERAGRLFEALTVQEGTPCSGVFARPQVHVVVFVQRVTGVSPGIYVLPRSTTDEALLRDALAARFVLQSAVWPGGPSVLRAAEGAMPSALRRICCGQAIASDSNLVFVLLVDLGRPLERAPHRYRELHWEAGLLGQILYLEAQAQGLAGTGIGCFFDDELHHLLGLSNARLQALYCFGVGSPILDARVETTPAYPQRERLPEDNQS